jgi:hypothetical protein
MSLCSLIYVHHNGPILDLTALVHIMNLGNELYSMLSRISRQSYLLLTELPTMVTRGGKNYLFSGTTTKHVKIFCELSMQILYNLN